MSRLRSLDEDAAMNEVSEVQPAGQNLITTSNSAFLTMLPLEMRNTIYKHCFPSLPAPRAPLDQAHLYRPATNLILANREVWNETSGYVRPVEDAWRAMTWTVDLDALARGVDEGKKSMLPDLSEEDAEMVMSVRFTTSAFPLPLPAAEEDDDEDDAKEKARSVFRAPFSFTITRLPSNRGFVLSSPHFTTETHQAQFLDGRYLVLLADQKIYLSALADRMTDPPGPRMRKMWEKLLSRAARMLTRLRPSSQMVRPMIWGHARLECERFKIWEEIRIGDGVGDELTRILTESVLFGR